MRVAVVVVPGLLSGVLLGAVLLGAVLLGGCGPEDTGKDRTPPRVIAIAPTDPVVPVDVVLRVTFSEALEKDTIQEDPTLDDLTVALVPRAEASEAFTNDFGNGGTFLESRQTKVVAIDVDLDGDVLEVRPTSPLEPTTAWTLLLSSGLSDAARNPLVDGGGLKADFRYDFETDGGQPTVIDVDVDGPGLVAPNRRRIVLTFNQPVSNLGNDTLTLSPPAPIEAILADEARTSATILIGAASDDGCERLAPSTTYTLTVSDGVVGDTGQDLAPFSTTFTTGGACDTAPNLIVDGPDAIAGEVAATLRFETTKPSTTEVRFGLAGGRLDCLGAACPVTGNPARVAVAGSSPPRFLHSVEVVGLTLDATYAVVVSAEDDVGITATAEVEFVTAALPRVSLNEVMANPSTSPEGKGEFVELANFGDAPVDVSAWQVLVAGGDDAGGCTAVLPESLSLNAGEFLVVAGSTFDETAYDGLAGAVSVIKLESGGMCTLVNGGAALLLTDADGRPVSSMSAFPSTVPRDDGVSIERTSPDAADVEPSFCKAKSAVKATPGRANSVTVGGCG